MADKTHFTGKYGIKLGKNQKLAEISTQIYDLWVLKSVLFTRQILEALKQKFEGSWLWIILTNELIQAIT